MNNHEQLVQHADDAYEAIRALNHGTYRTIPAPLAYAILGNLNGASYGLAQLLEQTANGLEDSLTEYAVYDNNREPADSVAIANQAMRAAAKHARELGDLLSAAQTAINQQGYNLPGAVLDDCASDILTCPRCGRAVGDPGCGDATDLVDLCGCE